MEIQILALCALKESDKKKMNILFKACKQWVNFIILSEREFNVMQQVDIHNWITIEQFMKGENKPFKRIATAYMIEKLTDKYSNACQSRILKDISEDLYNKIDTLTKYEKEHCQYSNDEVVKAILEVAEANNLFDMEVYHTYKEVKKVLDELPFIETICGACSIYSSREDYKWVLVMRDLFRYHRRRMGWKNYNITLNEEVVAPITEDIINEA